MDVKAQSVTPKYVFNALWYLTLYHIVIKTWMN